MFTPQQPARIGLCPGAEYGPAKRWPIEYFRALMDQLLPYPILWILIGTKAEQELAPPLVEDFAGRLDNNIGKTSLQELIELMKSFHLLLTNDTGSMHLAALYNIPTIALFGSTDPQRTGPQGALHRVIKHPVECSPCFLRVCPIDFRCMRKITPQEVAQALLEKLEIINFSSSLQ